MIMVGNLRLLAIAAAILASIAAGWKLRDGVRRRDGAPLRFEILLRDNGDSTSTYTIDLSVTE